MKTIKTLAGALVIGMMFVCPGYAAPSYPTTENATAGENANSAKQVIMGKCIESESGKVLMISEASHCQGKGNNPSKQNEKNTG